MAHTECKYVLLLGMILILIPYLTAVQSTLFKNSPLTVQGNTVSHNESTDSASYSQSRFLVFISDLHMGVGKDQSGKWHQYEDFRWKHEFDLFLREINRLGKGETDLILGGDTFELWQSVDDDCHYGSKNLGCTESDALNRIKRVIDFHGPELRALGKFANYGNNRLFLLPGNHDASIIFPNMSRVVLDAIQSAKGRAAILGEGYWLSADQRVYVEHGHQIGKEVNRFENWPAPFVEESGRRHLQRPWGEQFVQNYYNRFEKKYRIIDNMSSELAGIRYGLAAEGPAGLAEGVQDFLKFLLLQESWDQFEGFLGGKGKPPIWDIERIRREKGDLFLIESMPEDDPFRAAAAEALKENRLSIMLDAFSDEEIMDICDKRDALRKGAKNMMECPRQQSSLGAGTDLLRSKGTTFAKHLENTHRLLVSAGKTQRRFDVFLFGHTHRVDGFYPLKGNWNPLVKNMGAWQRVVTPKQLGEIKRAENLSDDMVLEALEPEQLPPCYSAIIIQPYTHKQGPDPRLSYWQETREGKWEFSDKCNWVPKVSTRPVNLGR